MRTLALAVLAICAAGCESPDPGPPLPSYHTEAGRACARTCQDTSSSCKLGCGTLMRGATTSRQRSQCSERCNATLADCYATCE